MPVNSMDPHTIAAIVIVEDADSYSIIDLTNDRFRWFSFVEQGGA